ncbi:DUF1254 domain-containing protein [Algiphilus sp. W345]|uniref:DUF1254 domain-containing protein n=1 Tax=Banduia mediterranea TaxID=3075609 RepID=A0ABU2WLZ9_9GAMM|nr:DUF1254 domain-containing protein [Algiphilus sp. W345]MDT0498644.1 DUF1254 domain-containing protein [Algiphilus sp. W345]
MQGLLARAGLALNGILALNRHEALYYFAESGSGGGDWNSIYHAPRTNASDRRMVMPSPDMLYSACPYDLKAGPLQVLAGTGAGAAGCVPAAVRL